MYNPSLHSWKEDSVGTTKDLLNSKIRQELRQWNQEHGNNPAFDSPEPDEAGASAEIVNAFTRLGDNEDFRRPADNDEAENDAHAEFSRENPDGVADDDPESRVLRKGDLVAVEFPGGEREPAIAVFARSIGFTKQAQLLTIHGKWLHTVESSIPYAIPGWIDPALVDPILPYLPEGEVTPELLDRAQVVDLSVPRHVSAPLISRMLSFQAESDEIYRKHARTLDNAHNILAHPTDLQFGLMDQVAARLLSKASERQPMSAPALYAVRKALRRAGFAFGIDPRSHRLTGSIHIRSKEQVSTVEQVRNAIRTWQDECAAGCTSRFEHRESQDVARFISKARRLIMKSRKSRPYTPHGRIGPSETRFEMAPGQPAIEYEYYGVFTPFDRQIIKFMEGWACWGIFDHHPRIGVLPSLLVRATKMYEDTKLGKGTGYTFLQEIGVILPHENRVHFDQHLLLPTSPHSKPLRELAWSVGNREASPSFPDAMADLRKDWGQLPVFCIDGEGAHEIDDGISVEKIGKHHWIHIHIANPTAFFDKDHDIAKMARHMTESIYMPDRAYAMMPPWASRKFFSLKDDRPCLTFSAKIDREGRTIEEKIVPGMIRNVIFLTPAMVSKALGLDDDDLNYNVLTVGGKLSAGKEGQRPERSLLPRHIAMLKIIQNFAEKRWLYRQARGGLLLDRFQLDLSVRSAFDKPGLAWDQPSHERPRFVKGEPIIQWKSPKSSANMLLNVENRNILVQEMMLLACEIGGKWCSDRGVPLLYRGTVPHFELSDPKTFWSQVLEPAIQKTGGNPPMHLTNLYMSHLGSTVLRTSAFPHNILGMPYYSKVTSPLRRYGDMLAHWQIQAALREEAKLGKSLVGSKRENYLPMSSGHLGSIATILRPRERLIGRATMSSEMHWVAQLLFRALYFGEAELPKTFQLFVLKEPDATMRLVRGIIKDYSFYPMMIKPEVVGLPEAKAGDWWECEINAVDCFNRVVTVAPLRLISRWE